WRYVDPTSGGLATADCPEVRSEPFLAGSEPHEPCTLHRPVWTALADGVGGVVRGSGRALDTAGPTLRDWFSPLFDLTYSVTSARNPMCRVVRAVPLRPPSCKNQPVTQDGVS